MIRFILGGARSGKSTYAEQGCLELSINNGNNRKPTYVATAVGFDEEMRHRISKHREQRKEKWHLIECPIQLAELLNNATDDQGVNQIILVDCLTVWLNNVVYEISNSVDISEHYELASAKVQQECKQLLLALEPWVNNSKVQLCLVANEIGLGIVPLGSSNRLFVDHMGWLNQGIAKIADSVTLVTAGIPQTLKGPATTQTDEFFYD